MESDRLRQAGCRLKLLHSIDHVDMTHELMDMALLYKEICTFMHHRRKKTHQDSNLKDEKYIFSDQFIVETPASKRWIQMKWTELYEQRVYDGNE